MNAFKRLKTTLCASFDSLVDELENQEAVVDATIKEIKKALVAIKLQENSIQREISLKLKNKEVIEKKIKTWSQRAKSIYRTDPEKAKECARKVINAKNHLGQIENNLEDASKTLQVLDREKRSIQEKLREVESKKTQFKARQTRTKAQSCLSSNSLHPSDIENVFNRWDDKILKQEITSEQNPVTDELESFFEQKKFDNDVEHELNEILKSDTE